MEHLEDMGGYHPGNREGQRGCGGSSPSPPCMYVPFGTVPGDAGCARCARAITTSRPIPQPFREVGALRQFDIITLIGRDAGSGGGYHPKRGTAAGTFEADAPRAGGSAATRGPAAVLSGPSPPAPPTVVKIPHPQWASPVGERASGLRPSAVYDDCWGRSRENSRGRQCRLDWH